MKFSYLHSLIVVPERIRILLCSFKTCFWELTGSKTIFFKAFVTTPEWHVSYSANPFERYLVIYRDEAYGGIEGV